MAACVYCQGKKGRRACPALLGSLCTACCGAHRLKDIACPPDCVFLGGLAVTRDPQQALGLLTEDGLDAALSQLVSYGRDSARAFTRAALAALGTAAPEEWAQSLLAAHMCLGYRDGDGLRLVDCFLRERAREISPAEAAAHLVLQQAWLSCFEVCAVRPGEGLDLLDLAAPGPAPLPVQEWAGSLQLASGTTLVAWVVPLASGLRFCGSVVTMAAPRREPVLAALRQARFEAQRRAPQTPERQLANGATGTLLRALRSPAQPATTTIVMLPPEAKH